MDPTDLKRDDIARKSIRISSSNRVSKRIAPVPPPRFESINTDIPKSSTISSYQEPTISQTPTDYNTQQLNIRNTLNSNMEAANHVVTATKTLPTSPHLTTFSYEKRSPILLSSARERVVVSSMIKKIDESTSKQQTAEEIDRPVAVNNSGTLHRNTKAKMDFFATINDKEAPVSLKQVTSQPATSTSIDVLNKLEQHINQMEIDTKTNELFSAIPTQPLIKMNNRYGDHTNLLNTGISNVTSGTALCYDADNDDDPEPAEFKRASESRNSTIAVSSSGASRGNGNGIGNLSKAKKPVSRAMSDTKNAETTVKIMRLKKTDDDDAKAAESARPPIGKPMIAMMSPLTNKKKEDTILMEADKVSLNSRARAVPNATAQQLIQPSSAPMPRRIVDRETLRHTVTPPAGTNRPKERVIQVKMLIIS